MLFQKVFYTLFQPSWILQFFGYAISKFFANYFTPCVLCSARCADPFTHLSNQRQACHLRIYTSPFARDSSHKSRGISGPFLLLFVIASYMINGRIYKQFVLSEQINSIISYFQIPWYNQREKTSGRLLLGNSCIDFSRHEYQGHQNVGSAWFAKQQKESKLNIPVSNNRKSKSRLNLFFVDSRLIWLRVDFYASR